MLPDALLALEMIGSDTGVALGLVITLALALGSALAAMIVARERHGAAIVTITKDNVERDKKDEDHEKRLRSLEEWRIRTESFDSAVKASGSTARGTQPYQR